MKQYQQVGLGEKMLQETRQLPQNHPRSIYNVLQSVGLPNDLALVVGNSYNETMCNCILDFYRSAIPNVAHDWWKEVKPVMNSKGLILLLTDPLEDEQRSREVAEKLHAETAGLDKLNHCWMAEAPDLVAQVLEHFWKDLK